MAALVSIIIPSYNAATTVVETLAAACSQTWEDIEVILVDDGSTDGTAEIAESYNDARVKVIRARRGGACRARNIGLRISKGAYIQYLDADDKFESNKIALQMEALSAKKDPGAVAYGPWWEFFDLTTTLNGTGYSTGRSYSEPMEWVMASMEEGFYLPPHCWLVPAALATAAGEWDERLLQNQDGEYFSRILRVAAEVVWVPYSISYYRGGDSKSISHQHSMACTHSLLLAADMIRDRTLAHLGDDAERRSIVSALYLRILYRMDCSDGEMLRQVWQRVDALGLPRRNIKVGGRKFDLLKRGFGWRLAFMAKHFIDKKPS